MSSYKELKVYKKAYEFAKEIYNIAKGFPKDEQFGLTSQIKRAATSIPLNIAEGYGKATGGKELVRFLLMARGSSAEVEVLLNFIKDFGYITEVDYKQYSMNYEEIGKMLTGLIHSINIKTNN